MTSVKTTLEIPGAASEAVKITLEERSTGIITILADRINAPGGPFRFEGIQLRRHELPKLIDALRAFLPNEADHA